MYTLPKGTIINNNIINDVIQYNEKNKDRYNKLKDYYIGKQDIINRNKVNGLKNNKIMVNHAKYITDINVGYLLGNPIDYKVNEDNEEYNIEPVLNEYKKQTISNLDNEIAKGISIYGLQYEYVYADEQANPKSCKLDNRNTIIVYDDTVEHNKLFGLIYRPIYEGNMFKYYDIIYCDKNVIRKYKSFAKMLQSDGIEYTHAFGDVPIICYRNNEECIGDFEEVISLIDAYNLLQSDRVNDKEQLVDAILCMYGMDFTDEQAEQLRSSRMIASIPSDAKVEYLVKQLQEADVDVLRQNIERDIHKISMTPDLSDENFFGNTSGVAIKYKLLAFEQSVKNKERYIEKGLMERFKLYMHYLSTKSMMQEIPIEDIDAVFTRNLPSNDYETSQMINNLADFIDKETLISQLSFVKDASKIVEKKEQEDEQNALDTTYNNAFGKNEIADKNKIKDNIEEYNAEE